MLRIAWSILQLVLNEMTPTSFATTRDVSVWVALVCVCAVPVIYCGLCHVAAGGEYGGRCHQCGAPRGPQHGSLLPSERGRSHPDLPFAVGIVHDNLRTMRQRRRRWHGITISLLLRCALVPVKTC